MTSERLSTFPAPHVAVDVATITVLPDHQLAILLHKRTGDRSGEWALPGRFVRPRERLAQAVELALQEKVGLSPKVLRDRRPRQLHLFDDPDRDDRGWVLSAAHLLALPYDRLGPHVDSRPDLTLAPVVDGRVKTPGRRRLPYGQDEIVRFALEEMRRLYGKEPDPERILEDEPFTLAELMAVHLAVGGHPWQIDTFRRHMQAGLVETGELSSGRPGRPATLYRLA